MINMNYLILGGTGTLGQELIKQILKRSNDDINFSITVISRDEHKHQKLKIKYPDINFVVGDIRDLSSVEHYFKNIDVVFHVAALKHVDIIEDNPIESIKTNILGTINVAEACIRNNVKYCIFSSTDKAVYPINVYGNCKALSEKLLMDYNKKQSNTRFRVYRWPNVIGSNGSVILRFAELMRDNKPIPVTDMAMTRFWIKIEDVVRFVLKTYDLDLKKQPIIFDKLKSASLLDVIEALSKVLNKTYNLNYVGLRKGEKIHEAMTYEHETGMILTSQNCPNKYTMEELKELIRGII